MFVFDQKKKKGQALGHMHWCLTLTPVPAKYQNIRLYNALYIFFYELHQPQSNFSLHSNFLKTARTINFEENSQNSQVFYH